MRVEKQYVVKTVALFIGIAYALVWYRTPYIAAGKGWLSLYLPAMSLIFPAILLLTLYSDNTPWLSLAYCFPGLAIGVSIDVLLFHSKVSRIAWLFELIGLCVIVAPVVICGTALGWWNRKRRAKFRQGI